MYRRREPSRPAKPRATPARALSVEERDAVVEQLNSERFADRSPRQVFAKLLDEGESSMPALMTFVVAVLSV